MRNTTRTQPYPPALDRGRALRILLAEDNRQLRSLLAMAMYNDGHFVDELADGYQLVEQIATLMIEERQDEVDVVIVEQELPMVPGLSVLAGLRARGHSIPFVLMTGNEGVQARARELGAAILDRPSDPVAIRKAIRQAIALAAEEVLGTREGTNVESIVVPRRGSA